MDMKKLRRKHNRYRCLKTVSYLLGFPLFIVLTLVASMCLFSGEVYADIKWQGIIACLVLWLVSIVAQAIISLITKNYNARTAFMLIVSVVLVIGGALICDIKVAKVYDEVSEKYSKYGVELNTYKYEAGWVSTWTSDKESVVKEYAKNADDFMRIYNIEYKSSVYGDYNANKGDDIANYKAKHDGSKEGMTEADFVLSKIVYDKEEDVYLSVNGLYADGYIFGYNQALNILIDYNQSKYDIEYDEVEVTDKEGNVSTKIVANGKNADTELLTALKALDFDQEWIAYKNSDEYKAVYGEGGKAYSFMLNIERLDKLLSALGSGVINSSIFNVVKNFVDVDGLLVSVGLTTEDIKTLSVAKVLEVVNGLLEGFAENEEVVNALAGFGIDATSPITEEVLLDVLANFSYYQYPTLKPKFTFLKDETLRTYAQAQYYAEVHGANVGSVLIGKNIGHVTMTSGGYDAETYAYSLKDLYTLKAQGELAQYYPYMIARKYGYIFCGIIAVTTVLFYLYKGKEDEMFMAITGRGGRR